MPTLDKEAIFNGNDNKVLRISYNNLKEDYTKENAIKHYLLYSESPLSFILDNSEFIFAEPMKGCGFYLSHVVSSTLMPFDRLYDEYNKVKAYYDTYKEQMSNEQKDMIVELVNILSKRVYGSKNAIRLAIHSDINNMDVYDARYEKYMIGRDRDSYYDIMTSFIVNTDMDVFNIIDKVNIALGDNVLEAELNSVINKIYDQSPDSSSENNAVIENILSRILSDNTMYNRLMSCGNITVKHTLAKIADVNQADRLRAITTESVSDYNPMYSTPFDAVNSLYEDTIYDRFLKEDSDMDKLNRLYIEKSIVDTNLSFLTVDYLTSLDESDILEAARDPLVEFFAIESTELESIPSSLTEQMDILQEKSDELQREIDILTERFTVDGSPTPTISKQTGSYQQNKHLNTNVYTDGEDDDEDDDDEDENAKYKKRAASKSEKDQKYASMDLDDDDLFKESKRDEEDLPEKPDKGGVFRRIQNKAIDTNVQFKKKVSVGQRKSQEARNAGKAVTAIPKNINDSIQKQIDEWDSLDDEKRKEYILKPGFRKKYFKGLRWAIEHYAAFQINPILNVMLAMCHKLGKTKDVRIRNEVLSELRTEVEVCKAKIDDADRDGNKDAKYKLMRIKDKLEAEIVRVTANSKTI